VSDPWHTPDVSVTSAGLLQVTVDLAVEMAYRRGVIDARNSQDWYREVADITLEAWKLAQLDRAERLAHPTRKRPAA